MNNVFFRKYTDFFWKSHQNQYHFLLKRAYFAYLTKFMDVFCLLLHIIL